MMADRSDLEMKKWSKLVAQAWTDENLKQRLLKDPAAVLVEHGINVPKGIEVRMVENTDNVTYLTLPAKPAGDITELTEKELAAVGGGRMWTSICWCTTCEQDIEIPPQHFQ